MQVLSLNSYAAKRVRAQVKKELTPTDAELAELTLDEPLLQPIGTVVFSRRNQIVIARLDWPTILVIDALGVVATFFETGKDALRSSPFRA
jgi:hypothetical protein